MTNTLTWRTWIKVVFGLLMGLVIIYVSISEALLQRLNESLGLATSISKQISQNSLYGRAIIGQDYLYKIEMAKAQKADLVVLGSSRVMPFRKEFFRESISFYNAGGAMPMIDYGSDFIDELTRVYNPKIVIIGIDMWWFNPNYNEKDVQIKRELISGNAIEQRIFLYGALFSFLNKERVPFRNLEIFEKNWSGSVDPVENRPAIGLKAASKGDGFRRDGSYQYGAIISGKVDHDKNFSDTLDRINKGTRRFQFTKNIDMDRLKKLRNLINTLKSRQIKVILLLPPFAHEVYETMQNSPNHSEFINEFERAIETLSRQEDIPCFNYSDILLSGANDSEMVDGFHGSEVSYARMLLKMSRTNPMIESIADQSRLASYLNSNPNPKGFIFPLH